MTDEKVSHSSMEANEKSYAVHHVDSQPTDVLHSTELMEDAFEGENREHAEGMWASVKKHPMACLWAFTMCFTIVSIRLRHNSQANKS